MGEIEKQLTSCGAIFLKLGESELIEEVAEAPLMKSSGLDEWSNGVWSPCTWRKKYQADPRSPKMQKQLNLKVKFRESFRPFAPSVLAEDVQDWFDIEVTVLCYW